MTLKPGCVTCEHVADVRGIDLTQPTPEAVEAVARAILAVRWPDGTYLNGVTKKTAGMMADPVLAFIRDAIHRDGPDADAIRETLGLYREVVRRDASTVRGWRAVGKWVQP